MTDIDTVSTSNGQHLGGRQWTALALFAAAMLLGLPRLWPALEKFELETDYRVPYDLSGDYFLCDRVASAASAKCDVLVYGDSVVWGQYVRREETLTHHLNSLSGRERFANLGLDGAHPAALAGLVAHYAPGVEGKKVVLLFNPLWMSSARHDLSADEEFRFNHPALVPQFASRPPLYREDTSKRLGLVVDRNLPFGGWTKHLQAAYFDRNNVPAWTLENPYRNPLGAVTLKLPPSDNTLRHEPISWTARGIAKQDFAWVELEKSYQWRAFRDAVETLEARGNRVFVIVGPFNEHLLTDGSLERFRTLKRGVEDWLKARALSHAVPAPLPSELYADSSHPLSAGYAKLAALLVEHPFFK